MSHTISTSIAAVMLNYGSKATVDMIIEDIKNSKLAKNASAVSIGWDCNNLVFIDIDILRIAIHDVPERDDRPRCICIGAGPIPGAGLPKSTDTVKIVYKIVKRLVEIIQASGVLWHYYDRSICRDVMDDFQDKIEKMLDHLEMQMHQLQHTVFSETEGIEALESMRVAKVTPKRVKSSNPRRRGTLLKDRESLQRLSKHLQDQGLVEEYISSPLHASMYIMATTFFFLVPAVGAGLFSYAALRSLRPNS